MIVVVGLSHQSAPIAVREKVALDDDAAVGVCRRLLDSGAAREAFVVSTCNRVEIFAVPPVGAGSDVCVAGCRAELEQRDPAAASALYVHTDLGAVRHLLRVASSLDSLVVGEPQILGQLRQGFERSRAAGMLGPVLHRVFGRAVRSARQVRSTTAIGAGQVSVPSIAGELAKQIFGVLRGHRVLLLGSGEMGQSVARLMIDAGASVAVLGRDRERILPLASELGAEAYVLDRLSELLLGADIVVSGTSAPHAVVHADVVRAVQKKRRRKNLFFIDLAVPRDVEPEVGEIDGVFLYNIDDLSAVADTSARSRAVEAERAAQLVEQMVGDFKRWADAEQVTPTIKALRARLRYSLELEMQRSLRQRLRDLNEEERRALSKMIDAGVNRFLHAPTNKLRQSASGSEQDSGEHAALLGELFELDDLPEDVLAHERSSPSSDDDADLSEPPVSEKVRLS